MSNDLQGRDLKIYSLIQAITAAIQHSDRSPAGFLDSITALQFMLEVLTKHPDKPSIGASDLQIASAIERGVNLYQSTSDEIDEEDELDDHDDLDQFDPDGFDKNTLLN